MKSRILAVAGVLLASATLAACGDDTPEEDTDVVVPPVVIEPAPEPAPAPTPEPAPAPAVEPAPAPAADPAAPAPATPVTPAPAVP